MGSSSQVPTCSRTHCEVLKVLNLTFPPPFLHIKQARTKQTARNVTEQPKDLAKRASVKIASESDVQNREGEERRDTPVPDVQDQFHSAPNSEQNEEEQMDVEALFDGANSGSNPQGDGQDSENGEDEERGSREKEIVEVDTSFSDSSGEAGNYLARSGGPLEEEQGENEQQVDALVDFPSSGPREVDIAMRPAVELPRPYDWGSPTVLNSFSQYRRGENMGCIITKLSRKGMLFDIDGMEEDEHAATWLGALKFVMYDIVITGMHTCPPFTRFQQSDLAWLDIAPSQLHPNGRAFLRAFELMCLFL